MKSVNETTSRPFEFIIHTICWGMFFGFSLFFTQRDNGTIDWNAFLHHSLVPASFFVIFYINYFLYIPRILFRNHLKQFLLLNLLTWLCLQIQRNLNHLMLSDIKSKGMLKFPSAIPQ